MLFCEHHLLDPDSLHRAQSALRRFGWSSVFHAAVPSAVSRLQSTLTRVFPLQQSVSARPGTSTKTRLEAHGSPLSRGLQAPRLRPLKRLRRKTRLEWHSAASETGSGGQQSGPTVRACRQSQAVARSSADARALISWCGHSLENHLQVRPWPE